MGLAVWSVGVEAGQTVAKLAELVTVELAIDWLLVFALASVGYERQSYVSRTRRLIGGGGKYRT